MFRWLLIPVCFGSCLNVFASDNLTSLQDKAINNWEKKVFSGETSYRLHEYKNRIALKATSVDSASGLVLKKQIDLKKTPYLNWSWATEYKLPALDEHNKSGDDYVARVYVVIDGGWLVWNTISLSYVWSSNQDKGQVWDNAFAGSNVKMLSVRGMQDESGQWYDEKRNVYQDLIDYFGDKGSDKKNLDAYRCIDVIAIMTDTDNSGSKAESYYGDIIFSPK